MRLHKPKKKMSQKLKNQFPTKIMINLMLRLFLIFLCLDTGLLDVPAGCSLWRDWCGVGRSFIRSWGGAYRAMSSSGPTLTLRVCQPTSWTSSTLMRIWKPGRFGAARPVSATSWWRWLWLRPGWAGLSILASSTGDLWPGQVTGTDCQHSASTSTELSSR